MATATSAKKQLFDVIECSICTDVFNDPRSLPCVHSYCLKCISKWCMDKQPGDEAACPLCRQDFAIPDGGVGDLPKNFFIGKLLKISELSSSETATIVCDLCSAEEADVQHVERTAEVFCLECQQNLCKSCKKVHSKMKATIAHTVITLGENPSRELINVQSLQTSFCDRHRNKPIEIYCLDCKATMCMLCYIKDHNPHKCSDVTEVAGEFRVSLTQDMQSLTAAIHRFDKKLEVLQSSRNVFTERAKKVESEVCERADHLKAMIDDEKQKLLFDVYQMKANHEKKMDNLAQEITQGKSLLESLHKYCTELVEYGTACDVIREATNLHRSAEELENTENIEDALRNCSVADVNIRPPSMMFDGTTIFLGEVIANDVVLHHHGDLSSVDATAYTVVDEHVINFSGEARTSCHLMVEADTTSLDGDVDSEDILEEEETYPPLDEELAAYAAANMYYDYYNDCTYEAW